jgi:hypothetical protein
VILPVTLAIPAAIWGSGNLSFLACVQDKNTKQIPISKTGLEENLIMFKKFILGF